MSLTEIPGILSKRAVEEHRKLADGYQKTLDRVNQALTNPTLPTMHQPESPYRALKEAEHYALGGVVLHELFFGNIAANIVRIQLLLEVERCIESTWGSLENFRAELRAACLSARGWAVLSLDPFGRLRILMLDSHDIGPVMGSVPILVIDMFEHAYWMDYGADRASYVEGILNHVDWMEVNRRFRKWADYSGVIGELFPLERRVARKFASRLV